MGRTVRNGKGRKRREGIGKLRLVKENGRERKKNTMKISIKTPSSLLLPSSIRLSRRRIVYIYFGSLPPPVFFLSLAPFTFSFFFFSGRLKKKKKEEKLDGAFSVGVTEKNDNVLRGEGWVRLCLTHAGEEEEEDETKKERMRRGKEKRENEEKKKEKRRGRDKGKR